MPKGYVRMEPKMKGALIQVAGVAVVLLGFVFALGLWFMNNENLGFVASLLIGLALIMAGGRLYRWGGRVRDPNPKPREQRSFRLSR